MNDQLYIYGTRAVIEAIDAGKEIEKVNVQKGTDNELHRHLRFLCNKYHIPLKDCPREFFEKYREKNHQGVVAVLSAIKFAEVEEVIAEMNTAEKMPLFLVLDGITDVRNLGAICRTAEVAGVNCIIVPQNNSAPFNEETIKASAGAIHHLKICRVNNVKYALQQLASADIFIFACTEKAPENIYNTQLNQPLALVMGNEAKGIAPGVLKLCNGRVSLPQFGHIGSLNVSVAAGIILYEVLRQRM
ncbi:MAG: 23S rRNA (guanosine(2251)-2'-O)-methyltransferase RlmB [Bacteroidota bacterium]|nr:23S rRNA (guanosine(2251)-2'-O)-methyltransferase RlmB [Bacteroidota bacterium]